jgi:hypothetical protein
MTQNPPPAFPWSDADVEKKTRAAVQGYWSVRSAQGEKQQAGERADAGSRGDVLANKHLAGFEGLIVDLVLAAGIARTEIHLGGKVAIPGFYRISKNWDLLVVRKGRLCAAVEFKSQARPSFGNNVNNRAEEAIGNAVDLWRAFQKQLLGTQSPWVGYFFLLDRLPEALKPIRPQPMAFAKDPAFDRSSYADRYRLLCQRMIFDRYYSAAALILSAREDKGAYVEPSADLSVSKFLQGLYGHLIGCL